MSAALPADRIRARTARLTVIGQGYVGLPLAVEFARAGFAVAGLDADPDRVAALSAGRSHSPDVRSEELGALLSEGRYQPASDPAILDCILILTDHAEFDYRRIVEAARLVVDTRSATWGIPAPVERVVFL